MDNLAALWGQYRKQGDRQARDELVVHYASLVKYVVGRLGLRLPPSLQEEDLVGYGILGLIDAVDRFDLDRGVKFETYAVARIRGYILDALRKLDILPRSIRRQAKEVESSMARLHQAFGRLPTDAEMAQHLNLTLEQYYNRLHLTNWLFVSLDEPLRDDHNDDEGYSLYDSLEDTSMPNPSTQVDDQELTTELTSAIQALPEREQLLLSLYYNDGFTMKEIGQLLEVSESRVSQMHAKIILMLRTTMKNRTEPALPIYQRSNIHGPIYAIR